MDSVADMLANASGPERRDFNRYYSSPQNILHKIREVNRRRQSAKYQLEQGIEESEVQL